MTEKELGLLSFMVALMGMEPSAGKGVTTSMAVTFLGGWVGGWVGLAWVVEEEDGKVGESLVG